MITVSDPRILIVKLSAVGDVVHALPVLNALRGAYPQAHIGWAVHPGPANLLEGHPQLDELIVLPRRGLFRGGLRAARSLLAGLGGKDGCSWDIALDIQGLTKSGLVTWLSGARRRVGFAGPDSRELNWIFMTDRVRFERSDVVRNNLSLLQPLGIGEQEKPQAVLHANEEDQSRVAEWSEKEQIGDEKFLIVDPFAGWRSKLWAQERWVELIGQMEASCGVRSLVFFGPGEQHEAEELAAKAAARGARPVVAPQTTLREYVALLRSHAMAFAGGDTGPMHIAAAVGVPVVALFGPSDSRRCVPAFAGARYEVIHDWSQPCAGTHARRCKHHPEPGGCLAKIAVEQVAAALQRQLS